jgi:hypothetical protein
MYYIYAHYKLSDIDGNPFYIGKGKNARDVSSSKRNQYWKNIVAKHGFVAKKIKENLTEQEAFDLEILMIAKFGKLIDNSGCLCNISDGGEGASGTIHTTETKEKWSSSKKGKTWEEIYGIEQAAAMRAKRKLSSRKHSLDTIKKMSDSKLGDKNPMYGKIISEDHSRRLSEAKIGKPSNSKGKKYPEETRQNYKNAAIIREADHGRRRNISSKLTGIKRSEETKQKMSAAAKLREAKKKPSTN